MTGILRTLYQQPGLTEGCAIVLGVDCLAVTLVTEGQVTEQWWSSDMTSSRFEDLEFTLGEGPGPDALRTGAPVVEFDVLETRHERWPALLPAMAGLPVRAVFCFPLRLGGITVGVLTALRAVPGAMDGQQMDDALALADVLTLQFLGGEGDVASWTVGQDSGELHRAVVHQATGMLSVQLGLSLAQSLLRLRAYAFSHDQPVTETAREIVARRLRLAGPPPDPTPNDEKRG